MKKMILFLLMIFPAVLRAQSPEMVKSFLGASDPVYVIDSVRSTKAQIYIMNQDDVLEVAIIKDASPLANKYGGKGILFVTTKQFAKKLYLEKFVQLSADYKKYVADKNGDDTVSYMVNGQKIVNDNSRLTNLYKTAGKAIEGFIFRKSDDGLTAAVTITAN